MPNQIKPDLEEIIYNYIIDYPTHGPRRIANELKIQGIIIERFLAEFGIRHTKIKPKSPKSNEIVERLNRTLLKEFYQMDKFIGYHNFKRTNQGYRLKGKTPYQKFLDGKRKYALLEPR